MKLRNKENKDLEDGSVMQLLSHKPEVLSLVLVPTYKPNVVTLACHLIP